MATSHRWPILLEMDEGGAYPEVLWDLADAMADRRRRHGRKAAHDRGELRELTRLRLVAAGSLAV